MTLVDTSVWVGHLRKGNDELRVLLNNGEVLSHRFIIGELELACGYLKNREEILTLLNALPLVLLAEHDEVIHFLHQQKLYGCGLGWIGVHLLASASLSKVSLWTMDRPLQRAAERVLKS